MGPRRGGISMGRTAGENPSARRGPASEGRGPAPVRAAKTEAAPAAATPSRPSTVEALFKMVVEQSRSLLSTYDPGGTFLYANRAFTRSLGYRVDEILGRNLFDLIHAEDREAARAAFESVLAGETVRDFEMRLLDRDGQPVHLLGSASAMRDDTGKAIAVCAMGTDVTEVRRLEEEIKAQ